MKFIEKISLSIHELPEPQEKKDLAIILIRYWLSFNTKSVHFSLAELSIALLLSANYLNQPYDTFENEPGFEKILLQLGYFSAEDLPDQNKFLSLLESTVRMLMRYQLIFGTESSNTATKQISFCAYSVLLLTFLMEEKDDFFPSSFDVTFSDDFWRDFQEYQQM